jgi:TRAP-type C4-dicarboxylate transport system permease small subunit
MADGQKRIGFVKTIIDSIVDSLKKASDVSLFIIMTGMGLVLGANIALRYLFNQPLNWSNTISRYAYIYIVLLGTAVSYIEGQHASIDFVYNAAPKRLKILFNFCHYLVMMFLSAVLIIIGTKHSIGMWHVSAPILPWLPVGIVYLSVPICAAVMLVFLVQKMFELRTF